MVSSDPVANKAPSGDHRTLYTELEWPPSNLRANRLLRASHIYTVPSSLPEHSKLLLLIGLKSTAHTPCGVVVVVTKKRTKEEEKRKRKKQKNFGGR